MAKQKNHVNHLKKTGGNRPMMTVDDIDRGENNTERPCLVYDNGEGFHLEFTLEDILPWWVGLHDRFVKEFRLDKDAAHLVVNIALLHGPFAPLPVWHRVCDAVREEWWKGEQTGERLTALLLQYVATANL